MAASPTTPARPGRPASDASERIVEATLEVLAREGYADLTTAKVAAESGQNKAMISYYFGSKAGLLSEVARQVAEAVVEEIVRSVGQPQSPRDLVAGLVDGLVGLAQRDPRLPQVYIDLISRSGVDDEPRRILSEMKNRFRVILGDLVAALDDSLDPARMPAVSTYLFACLEGFMLEQLDRGETDDLIAARAMFVSTAEAAIAGR